MKHVDIASGKAPIEGATYGDLSDAQRVLAVWIADAVTGAELRCADLIATPKPLLDKWMARYREIGAALHSLETWRSA